MPVGGGGESEQETRKKKKVRRGTRGGDRCKPLHGKEQKIPNADKRAAAERQQEEEQQSVPEASTEKTPFTQRLSDLTEAERREAE